MSNDPLVIAEALNRCVNQDVCGVCPYLEVPNGHYGECINELMSDACIVLRTDQYRIAQVTKLHDKMKRSNVAMRREIRKLREELSRYKEVEDVSEWNESDTED